MMKRVTEDTLRSLGERGKVGNALNNFGVAERRHGNFQQAIEYHQRALEIFVDQGDRFTERIIYENLGIAYKCLGDFKRAIEYYTQSLRIAEELGDKAQEGIICGYLGKTYDSASDFKQAIELQKKRLYIAKEVGDKDEEGDAYCDLGIAYSNLGDSSFALEYHKQQLRIARELGDRVGEMRAYGNLGSNYHSLGDFALAIENHMQCLTVAKEVGDKSGEGKAYGNLGQIYAGQGDFKQAIEHIRHDLSIAQKVGDRDEEASAHGNLGSVYFSVGDFQKAMEYHKRHLSFTKELGNRYEEGLAYGNLGLVYRNLGDIKKAIENHMQQLRIAKELGDRPGEGRAYGSLGNAYYFLGECQQAVENHKQRLRIAKELGDKVGEGRGYSNLGVVYHGLGDFQQAIEHHIENLSIAKELGQRDAEGAAYGNLGSVYHSLGTLQEALENHNQSLSIAIELGNKAREGIAYGNLGAVNESLGDLKKAIEYQRRYLDIAKKLGWKVNEGGAHFSLGQALELSGGLLEALYHYRSSVKVFNDARALLQSEDVWKISFRDTCRDAYIALFRTLVTLQETDEALCVAEQGRGQALKDLMKLQYGTGLLETETFKAEEAISEMLRSASKQIVFVALESSTIYLWVICEDNRIYFRQKELDRENAETALESLRKSAFKEIRGAGQVRCEDRSLDELREDHSTTEETVQEPTTSKYASDSLRLFYVYIVGPIADLLEGEELIIVPDGPLCLSPIAAFLDDESKYLSETIRLRILPSLMSLKQITDCPEDYHSNSGVLLVGNPYVKEVKRVREKRVQLQQLPCALEEVTMIGKILNTEPLTGRNATKEEVLQRIGSVALIHIAAHGNMQNGEIVLTPNPTRPSKVPKDDDFLLKMSDIQAVKLRAKLVVLSCCHSAQGKVSAEGVVGIARAFLGAGARSVVVSLWAIDDEATMEFMKSFYQHLSRGDSASVALNRAMKCLRESEKFGAAKYWALFLLIGDDVTITFAENKCSNCE